MLTERVYKILVAKNTATKYNIEYCKKDIKQILCANYINDLLLQGYNIKKEQKDMLRTMINNLVYPNKYWFDNEEAVMKPIVLETVTNDLICI